MTTDLLSAFDTKITLYNGKGWVEILDMMPRIVNKGRTADQAICQNARVSTGKDVKSVEEDIRLINYLYKHRHTSPFEAVSFKFRIRLPIFIERQLCRHRTAKINQRSYRYSPAIDDYFLPKLRMQNLVNKQGSSSEAVPDDAVEHWKEAEKLVNQLQNTYKSLIATGISREVARCILPVGQMTELVWTMDLHNLIHFLQLRRSEEAQVEIQELANAISGLIRPRVPVCFEAAFPEFSLK